MEEDLLTASQVGKILGVTSAAVLRWCKAGDFPNAWRQNPSLPKSRWRIPRSDVDAFIQRRRQQYGFIRLPVAPVDNDQLSEGDDHSKKNAAQLMLVNMP